MSTSTSATQSPGGPAESWGAAVAQFSTIAHQPILTVAQPSSPELDMTAPAGQRSSGRGEQTGDVSMQSGSHFQRGPRQSCPDCALPSWPPRPADMGRESQMQRHGPQGLVYPRPDSWQPHMGTRHMPPPRDEVLAPPPLSSSAPFDRSALWRHSPRHHHVPDPYPEPMWPHERFPSPEEFGAQRMRDLLFPPGRPPLHGQFTGGPCLAAPPPVPLPRPPPGDPPVPLPVPVPPSGHSITAPLQHQSLSQAPPLPPSSHMPSLQAALPAGMHGAQPPIPLPTGAGHIPLTPAPPTGCPGGPPAMPPLPLSHAPPPAVVPAMPPLPAGTQTQPALPPVPAGVTAPVQEAADADMDLDVPPPPAPPLPPPSPSTAPPPIPSANPASAGAQAGAPPPLPPMPAPPVPAPAGEASAAGTAAAPSTSPARARRRWSEAPPPPTTQPASTLTPAGGASGTDATKASTPLIQPVVPPGTRAAELQPSSAATKQAPGAAATHQPLQAGAGKAAHKPATTAAVNLPKAVAGTGPDAASAAHPPSSPPAGSPPPLKDASLVKQAKVEASEVRPAGSPSQTRSQSKWDARPAGKEAKAPCPPPVLPSPATAAPPAGTAAPIKVSTAPPSAAGPTALGNKVQATSTTAGADTVVSKDPQHVPPPPVAQAETARPASLAASETKDARPTTSSDGGTRKRSAGSEALSPTDSSPSALPSNPPSTGKLGQAHGGASEPAPKKQRQQQEQPQAAPVPTSTPPSPQERQAEQPQQPATTVPQPASGSSTGSVASGGAGAVTQDAGATPAEGLAFSIPVFRHRSLRPEAPPLKPTWAAGGSKQDRPPSSPLRPTTPEHETQQQPQQQQVERTPSPAPCALQQTQARDIAAAVSAIPETQRHKQDCGQAQQQEQPRFDSGNSAPPPTAATPAEQPSRQQHTQPQPAQPLAPKLSSAGAAEDRPSPSSGAQPPAATSAGAPGPASARATSSTPAQVTAGRTSQVAATGHHTVPSGLAAGKQVDVYAQLPPWRTEEQPAATPSAAPLPVQPPSVTPSVSKGDHQPASAPQSGVSAAAPKEGTQAALANAALTMQQREMEDEQLRSTSKRQKLFEQDKDMTAGRTQAAAPLKHEGVNTSGREGNPTPSQASSGPSAKPGSATIATQLPTAGGSMCATSTQAPAPGRPPLAAAGPQTVGLPSAVFTGASTAPVPPGANTTHPSPLLAAGAGQGRASAATPVIATTGANAAPAAAVTSEQPGSASGATGTGQASPPMPAAAPPLADPATATGATPACTASATPASTGSAAPTPTPTQSTAAPAPATRRSSSIVSRALADILGPESEIPARSSSPAPVTSSDKVTTGAQEGQSSVPAAQPVLPQGSSGTGVAVAGGAGDADMALQVANAVVRPASAAAASPSPSTAQPVRAQGPSRPGGTLTGSAKDSDMALEVANAVLKPAGRAPAPALFTAAGTQAPATTAAAAVLVSPAPTTSVVPDAAANTHAPAAQHRAQVAQKPMAQQPAPAQQGGLFADNSPYKQGHAPLPAGTTGATDVLPSATTGAGAMHVGTTHPLNMKSSTSHPGQSTQAPSCTAPPDRSTSTAPQPALGQSSYPAEGASSCSARQQQVTGATPGPHNASAAASGLGCAATQSVPGPALAAPTPSPASGEKGAAAAPATQSGLGWLGSVDRVALRSCLGWLSVAESIGNNASKYAPSAASPPAPAPSPSWSFSFPASPCPQQLGTAGTSEGPASQRQGETSGQDGSSGSQSVTPAATFQAWAFARQQTTSQPPAQPTGRYSTRSSAKGAGQDEGGSAHKSGAGRAKGTGQDKGDRSHKNGAVKIQCKYKRELHDILERKGEKCGMGYWMPWGQIVVASTKEKGCIGSPHLSRADRTKLLKQFKDDPDLHVTKKNSDQRITLLFAACSPKSNKGAGGGGSSKGGGSHKHAWKRNHGQEQQQQEGAQGSARTANERADGSTEGRGAGLAPEDPDAYDWDSDQQLQPSPVASEVAADPTHRSAAEGQALASTPAPASVQGTGEALTNAAAVGIAAPAPAVQAPPPAAALPPPPSAGATAAGHQGRNPLPPPPPPSVANGTSPAALYLILDQGKQARYSEAPPVQQLPPLATGAPPAAGEGGDGQTASASPGTQHGVQSPQGGGGGGVPQGPAADEEAHAGQNGGHQGSSSAPRPRAAAGWDPDAASLLGLLPASVACAAHDRLEVHLGGPGLGALVEVCLDEGRPAVLRLSSGKRIPLQETQGSVQEALNILQRMRSKNSGSTSDHHHQHTSTAARDAPAGASAARMFGPDHRMGIPGTLHRISAFFTSSGAVSGLTYRVGRHVPGAAAIFGDVLQRVADAMAVPQTSALPPHAFTSGPTPSQPGGPQFAADLAPAVSLLLVGRPGLGKTLLLRDMARHLADEAGLAVVVVDTSLEIGGASHVPHPAIGSARRMEVLNRDAQHLTLLEAVQNHTPQVVVVDEVGTKQEALAIKSIAQRGIAMVGTAHGTDLTSLMRNGDLNALVGGIQTVTLGDRMAAGGNKTRSERAGPPPFTCLIECLGPRTWRLHHDVAESVDLALQGRIPNSELRWYDDQGHMRVRFETPQAARRAGQLGI